MTIPGALHCPGHPSLLPLLPPTSTCHPTADLRTKPSKGACNATSPSTSRTPAAHRVTSLATMAAKRATASAPGSRKPEALLEDGRHASWSKGWKNSLPSALCGLPRSYFAVLFLEQCLSRDRSAWAVHGVSWDDSKNEGEGLQSGVLSTIFRLHGTAYHEPGLDGPATLCSF
ncbi:hypothetical protein BDV95DRAFT_90401 [Massariosphaeria phaeospora]|uniref:Uncharacterized protein n=1 Tax=Massariosphaeria phaeospora TaxID=100035 RepID=A0A7C8I737_9PLEO|nr:hypothetical protein BDV95DRAFT_90401 [Massariosphaeria phaeospora]